MKKIAVIMSLYKNDKVEFLIQCVDSIINQTYSNFDFYIQYDGPIDQDCATYLENIKDDRLILRKREENKGLAYSLNEILKVVLDKNYSYIARMDADDISFINRFKRQINFLDANADVDCVGSWAIEIDNDENEFFKKQMPVSHDECNKMFMIRDCLIHPTVMFRCSYFKKAGLYPEDTYFGEDTMMWANGFATNCIFANISEYLLYFRLDENFFERRRGWKHAKSILLLRKRVNKLLGYGFKSTLYAYLYALVKLMPTFILNRFYKFAR